jgi:hypothetical protein
MIDGIREVLDFWFAPSSKAHWFEPSEAFDRAVAERLGKLHRRAASGDLAKWRSCAEGCLALCILLDQAPRQLYRGTARAFATDASALSASQCRAWPRKHRRGRGLASRGRRAFRPERTPGDEDRKLPAPLARELSLRSKKHPEGIENGIFVIG